MAVFGVYLSSRTKNGNTLDTLLRERFRDVYRVGVEFWLIDSRGDAEDIAHAMKGALSGPDKMFVAVLERDVVPVLSRAAHTWLNAPERRWKATRPSHGTAEPAADETPFAIAA